MIPELQAVEFLRSWLHSRRAALRQNEYGYTTESVLITALLGALAIVVVAIIATKVVAKANSISTE